MARLARAVAVGFAHHIAQRGNNRQDVFFVDDDRLVYVELLCEQADKYGLEVIGYCLMTNHVHLVASPRKEDSLAKAIGRTHFRYTQYINRFHKRSGHLWQGRFYSCALDERHFWLAMRYVELNPVRAKICRKPWRYEWSSAAAHVDGDAESELLNLSRWYDMMSARQWREALADGLDEQEVARLRVNTHTGRPLGGDSFMSKPTCTISPDTSLAKIMENMCQADRKCLPVVDDQGKVQGLVTVFDIFSVLLKHSLRK